MKTRLRSVLAIGLFFFCGFTHAEVTFGDVDCAQWFKQPPAKAWALGYLSGINAAIADDKKKFDPLDKLNSADQAYLWIDSYCRTNPLDKVSRAAFKLYIELSKK